MRNQLKPILFSILSIGLITNVFAKENEGVKFVKPVSTPHKLMKYAASCDPATASADLDVNNVRTKILNGGDRAASLSTGEAVPTAGLHFTVLTLTGSKYKMGTCPARQTKRNRCQTKVCNSYVAL